MGGVISSGGSNGSVSVGSIAAGTTGPLIETEKKYRVSVSFDRYSLMKILLEFFFRFVFFFVFFFKFK